ncbi:MAG TPA: TetR family transcriptional regulator, partial [Pseudomonas sp.]|nr:TetR family transcriptional regulator [Pseudomonas sp.]
DTGSPQHCVESLRQQLEALMHAGVVPDAPSLALAQLINGSLVNTALWIARSEHPQERLEQGLQGLEILLRGLKLIPTA